MLLRMSPLFCNFRLGDPKQKGTKRERRQREIERKRERERQRKRARERKRTNITREGKRERLWRKRVQYFCLNFDKKFNWH